MKNKINTQKRYSVRFDDEAINSKRKLLLQFSNMQKNNQLVMISTFPPRECGIATYCQDLIKALQDKFDRSYDIKICALENENHQYNNNVNYILETTKKDSYTKFVNEINLNSKVNLLVLQHEFGLFRGNENDLLQMLLNIQKEIIVVFHTVLPKPTEEIQQYIQNISKTVTSLIVMTNDAKEILEQDYLIETEKITVIPHGTHLVEHIDKKTLKEKFGYQDRKVLATFGLLSSGKSIETTLRALPAICKVHPQTLFLIIGKTHPTVVKQEGEKYRENLLSIINNLKLEKHVAFINEYLPLSTLLEYLQLTDVYLFTSKDPNQAVSGTFSYAMSCGCPIISTPIPHAREVLQNGAGHIIDFENSEQLSQEVVVLLNNQKVRNVLSSNGLHLMAPSAWENSALAHVKLFEKTIDSKRKLKFKMPEINYNHLKKMTTDFGIIQFSVLNKPDINSGYTLDDNARALIAMCQNYKLYRIEDDLKAIECYLNFILYCFRPDGYFVNYVSKQKKITLQNKSCNLEDSSGRAIWALGYLISLHEIMPKKLIDKTETVFQKALIKLTDMCSIRAMAFSIKGIYYANLKTKSNFNLKIIEQFADRMVQMYHHEADKNWQWFESYLTYANSVMPEAMLFAWKATKKNIYQSIALLTFDFLHSKIFTNNYLQVISNKGWLHNGQELNFDVKGGEQPIDVSYTIMALSEFYNAFKIKEYKHKMKIAFNWFLGYNHLNQIVYNPCTGGCYDGLERNSVNLNQGAESTLSYLLARLTMENSQIENEKPISIHYKELML